MFYLEEPTINRKEDFLNYIEEFIKYNSDTNGFGLFYKILNGLTYEECLDIYENMKDPLYAKSINRCPGRTCFLINKEENQIIGMINVRYNLPESMLKFGGHIGYSIRPTKRNKGYNKINLYLGLKIAQELGLEQVMLDCTTKNIASNKTIQALGGILTRCEIDPWDNELTNIYWINVQDSLKKYKDTYEQYLQSPLKK